MMDELKQQFYEVMHKYQKPFSEEGVTANLTQWYEQKQGLLQLLRKHPLWNEKELAIVFRVEERREIDHITVDETRAAILELGRRACTDDTVYGIKILPVLFVERILSITKQRGINDFDAQFAKKKQKTSDICKSRRFSIRK